MPRDDGDIEADEEPRLGKDPRECIPPLADPGDAKSPDARGSPLARQLPSPDRMAYAESLKTWGVNQIRACGETFATLKRESPNSGIFEVEYQKYHTSRAIYESLHKARQGSQKKTEEDTQALRDKFLEEVAQT